MGVCLSSKAVWDSSWGGQALEYCPSPLEKKMKNEISSNQWLLSFNIMTLPMCCWLAECLACWQKKGDAGWLAHWQKTDNRAEMLFSIFLSSKEHVEPLELLVEPSWTQLTAVCTPFILDNQWINKKNCLGSRDQNSRCLSFPLQFLNFLSSYTEIV